MKGKRGYVLIVLVLAILSLSFVKAENFDNYPYLDNQYYHIKKGQSTYDTLDINVGHETPYVNKAYIFGACNNNYGNPDGSEGSVCRGGCTDNEWHDGVAYFFVSDRGDGDPIRFQVKVDDHIDLYKCHMRYDDFFGDCGFNDENRIYYNVRTSCNWANGLLELEAQPGWNALTYAYREENSEDYFWMRFLLPDGSKLVNYNYYFTAVDKDTMHYEDGAWRHLHLNEGSEQGDCSDSRDNDGDWRPFTDIYDEDGNNAPDGEYQPIDSFPNEDPTGEDIGDDTYNFSETARGIDYVYGYISDPSNPFYYDISSKVGNGFPDFGEYGVDCLDPSCNGREGPGGVICNFREEDGHPKEYMCSDGKDNDFDGLPDTEDPDCREGYVCDLVDEFTGQPWFDPSANDGSDGCCGDDYSGRNIFLNGDLEQGQKAWYSDDHAWFVENSPNECYNEFSNCLYLFRRSMNSSIWPAWYHPLSGVIPSGGDYNISLKYSRNTYGTYFVLKILDSNSNEVESYMIAGPGAPLSGWHDWSNIVYLENDYILKLTGYGEPDNNPYVDAHIDEINIFTTGLGDIGYVNPDSQQYFCNKDAADYEEGELPIIVYSHLGYPVNANWYWWDATKHGVGYKVHHAIDTDFVSTGYTPSAQWAFCAAYGNEVFNGISIPNLETFVDAAPINMRACPLVPPDVGPGNGVPINYHISYDHRDSCNPESSNWDDYRAQFEGAYTEGCCVSYDPDVNDDEAFYYDVEDGPEFCPFPCYSWFGENRSPDPGEGYQAPEDMDFVKGDPAPYSDQESGSPFQTCDELDDLYDPDRDLTRICEPTEMCINGYFILSSDAGSCCYGENAACVAIQDLTCAEVGVAQGQEYRLIPQNTVGVSCESVVITSDAGPDDDYYCCIGAIIWEQDELIPFSSNESFVCYQEQGNSVFAECCSESVCQTFIAPDDYYNVFSQGSALHTVRSFDRINGPGVTDYYRGTNITFSNVGDTFDISLNDNDVWGDWSYYNVLEFDLLYEGQKWPSQFFLIDDDENIVMQGNMSDYSIVANFTDRYWHHIIIDFTDYKYVIDNITMNKIVFNISGADRISPPSVVYYDNFVLKSDDPEKDNYYCTGPFGSWIPSLTAEAVPPETNDFQEYGPYWYACDAQLSFKWTGSRCCGADTQIGDDSVKEFYNDSWAGCWKGVFVADGQTVSEVLLDNSIDPHIMYYQGQFHSCKIPDTRSGINGDFVETIVEEAFATKGNYYCHPSNRWLPLSQLSTTRILASKMLDMAKNSDYFDRFSLFCGLNESETVVNNYLGLNVNTSFIRSICVLKYMEEGGDVDKVIMGFDYDSDNVSKATDDIIKRFHPLQEQTVDCSTLPIITSNEEFFSSCVGDTDIHVYGNRPYQLLLFSMEEVDEFEPEGFFENIWEGLINFFRNIFGIEQREQIRRAMIPIELDHASFEEVYITRMGDKYVDGVKQKGYANYSDGSSYHPWYIRVEYVNLSNNVEPMLEPINLRTHGRKDYKAGVNKQVIIVRDPFRFDWRYLTSNFRLISEGEAYNFGSFEDNLHNGVIDLYEECDDDGFIAYVFDQDANTCEKLGLETGSLVCDNGVIDTSYCGGGTPPEGGAG
jgi:hypothetical protein